MTLATSEISLYRKAAPTKQGIAIGLAKIKKAFPKITQGVLDILKERFAENNFSDRKIIDSINHVIDNYGGWDKNPNIAEFIQYDRTIKTYTYNEAIALCSKANPMDKMFDCVKIGGATVWVEKGQKARFNLKGCEREKNADKR